MRPHVVRTVEDAATGSLRETVAKEVGRIEVKPEALELVKNAMVAVNKVGTGRIPFQNTEYVAAGKTGTAQVIGIKQNEKYDAAKIAERHRDHSLFVAFAPVDKPKIAVALIVENGGFGAQAAAPIARKLFDYYLLGKLPKDQDLPFPERQDEEEMRDVPASIEPELAPDEAATPSTPEPSPPRQPAPSQVAAAPREVVAAPQGSATARGPRPPRSAAAVPAGSGPPAEAATAAKAAAANPKRPPAPSTAPAPAPAADPAARGDVSQAPAGAAEAQRRPAPEPKAASRQAKPPRPAARSVDEGAPQR